MEWRHAVIYGRAYRVVMSQGGADGLAVWVRSADTLRIKHGWYWLGAHLSFVERQTTNPEDLPHRVGTTLVKLAMRVKYFFGFARSRRGGFR